MSKNYISMIFTSFIVCGLITILAYIGFKQMINNKTINENVDLKEISQKLNDEFSIFLSQKSEVDGSNLLDVEINRLYLVNYKLMANNENEIYRSDVDTYAYVSYSKYKDMYKSIYGTNYNLTKDITKIDTTDMNLNEDKITWDYTKTESVCILEALNVAEKNKEKIITGDFSISLVDEVVKNGSFEIKYKNDYLISIILK